MSKCELSLQVLQIASISQKLINMKTTDRKSWAANLFMWSDLTLEPSCLLLVLEVCSVHFTTRFRVFCRYTGAKRRVHIMIPSRGDS